jgi:hypothetical protein
MPVMITEELLMENAVPDGCRRRLQSKMVVEGTPEMTSEDMSRMLTVESLKKPAVRLMLVPVLVERVRA